MGGKICWSGSILSTPCGRVPSFRALPSHSSCGSSLERRWSKNGNWAALGSRLASKREIFSSLLPTLLMSYVGKRSGQNLLVPCIFIWDCQSSPERSKRHLKRIWKQSICGMSPVSKIRFKLRKTTELMAAHLEEEFSLIRLAREADMSEFHFSRLFKRTTGLTPSQYFIHLRMEKARRLLRETTKSVIEIGLEVGYTSPSHFAQVFRREVGIPPSEYRRPA